ncbi:MAG: response regulator transcription factor [Nitrospirota bacterium]|nr:response regulator transcription factor [Nitrospirota bacterium]
MKPTHKRARPSAQKEPRRERHPQLTPRQRQVLRLVRDGLTSREIANRFGLSVRTVEVHRYLLMRRLGAKNVAQLLRTAIRQRILKY